MSEHVTENPQDRQHIIDVLCTLQENQLEMIVMADQKANILFAGALILLSILTTQFTAEIRNHALMVLTLSSIVAAVFAVLASKPKIRYTRGEEKKFNLLFFGDFTNMTSARFHEEMDKVSKEEGDVYRVVVEDIYQTGLVLKRKYRYLAYSYRTFLTGIGLTALTFAYQSFL